MSKSPSPILGFLKQVDNGIEKLEGWTLIAILSAMMVVAFAQVFLRNFFNTAISWGDGLTRALVLWAGFIGASMAVKQGRYINVDAFSRLFGEAAKRKLKGVIYLFSSGVCFMLGMAGVDFIKMEREAGTTYSIGVASWIVESIIPVIFFFLTFRFILKLLSVLAGEPLEKQEWEH